MITSSKLTYRQLQSELSNLRDKGYEVPRLNSKKEVLLAAYNKLTANKSKPSSTENKPTNHYSMVTLKTTEDKVDYFFGWVESDPKLYSYLNYLNVCALLHAKQEHVSGVTQYSYGHPLNLDYCFALAEKIANWLHINPFFSDYNQKDFYALAVASIRHLL